MNLLGQVSSDLHIHFVLSSCGPPKHEKWRLKLVAQGLIYLLLRSRFFFPKRYLVAKFNKFSLYNLIKRIFDAKVEGEGRGRYVLRMLETNRVKVTQRPNNEYANKGGRS